MKIHLVLGVSAILIGTASDLYAQAIVTSLHGPVLVNHGAGFVRLAINAPLAPTDRVMANPGGDATITYADGCVVHVTPGSVVSVGNTPPCGAPEPPVDAILPLAAVGAVGAVAIGVGLSGSRSQSSGSRSQSSSFSPPPISP